jgi:methionyl-tRNA formyltransferase
MLNTARFMKIVFWGTPELTTEILEEMKKENLSPSFIVTNPDRPQGRKMALTPPPAKIWAQMHNIEVLQPEKLDDSFISYLNSLNLDLFVVVAYGKILPEEIINMPKYGTLNVHYSLLPRWRGATPVESAILSGDEKTGVCIQKMVYKLDAGDIYNREEVSILENEKAIELRSRLNTIGKKLLIKTIREIENNTATLTPQNHALATKCGKISKEDGEIDPSGDPIENNRKFRAYFGWPGIYFFINNDGRKTRVVIKDAQLIFGKFVIKNVVPEGKKEIPYEDFIRSYGIK